MSTEAPTETGPFRDQLALDRTNLANERTMLAWVRTSLGMIIAGLTFYKFFQDDRFYVVVGTVSVALGFVTLSIGLQRYFRLARRYGRLKAAAPRLAPELKEELRKPV